jgi:hypothetical protein
MHHAITQPLSIELSCHNVPKTSIQHHPALPQPAPHSTMPPTPPDRAHTNQTSRSREGPKRTHRHTHLSTSMIPTQSTPNNAGHRGVPSLPDPIRTTIGDPRAPYTQGQRQHQRQPIRMLSQALPRDPSAQARKRPAAGPSFSSWSTCAQRLMSWNSIIAEKVFLSTCGIRSWL